jgi:hypothetical protein
MGNLDGNAKNDLTTADGTVIAPPPSIEQLKTFGDSWRVPAEESLFRNPLVVEEEETEVAPILLRDIDPADRATAEQTCRDAGITDETALRNCIYDVAVTGDPIFVESAQLFEETVKDLPPSAKVPAVAGETTGGNIFDADMGGAESIMIMDGDDVIVSTGTTEEGTSYIRYNIYRDGIYVAGYSVTTDAAVADAVAGAVAGPVAPPVEEALEEAVEEPESSIPAEDLAQIEEAVPVCLEGMDFLANNMYEYPAEIDGWTEVYATFTTEFLPACDYIGTFLDTYADSPELASVEAQFNEFGIESWQNLFAEGGSVYGITFHGSRIVQYCPDLHQVQYDCVTGPERINNSIEAVFSLLGE